MDGSINIQSIISAGLGPLVVSLLTALVTAFITTRTYARQVRIDLEKEYERKYNEKKWEAYTQFADTLREVLVSSKNNRMQSEMPRILNKLYGFMSALWLVGSDEVVQAYIDWQKSSQGLKNGDSSQNIEMLVKLFTIPIVMRGDLGYRASKITPRDLLATFVPDIDNYLAKSTL